MKESGSRRSLLPSKWHWDDRVGADDVVMDRPDRLLTVSDLATYLGVPVATLYAWRHRHEGPPGFKAGRHLRYRMGDVERWITEQVQETIVHSNPFE